MHHLAGYSKDWEDAKRRFALRVAQDPVDVHRPSYTTTSDAYIHELYQDVVQPHKSETFLHGTDCYSVPQGRWATPSASTTRETLVNSIFNIIRSIVGHFTGSQVPGAEREVVNAFYAPRCSATDSRGYRACPSLLVRAAGPSFEVPPPLNALEPSPFDLGFSSMATYFSVKPESETPSEKEIVDEMESYARCVSAFRHLPTPVLTLSLLVKSSASSRTEFTSAHSPSPRITLGSSTSTELDVRSPLPSTFTSTPALSFDSSPA